MDDGRRSSPAAQRNRGPILDVLRAVLPHTGVVLEIASGSGEHIVHFAEALPALIFQPSDQDRDARHSIAAWIAASGLANLRPPIALDAATSPWPLAAADAILCINMIHISPWVATEGLMRGAGRLLAAGAPLFLYGPYKRDGAHTAPSNEAFDRSLRARDSSWGVRDISAVTTLAHAAGFVGPDVAEMPANNFSLVFRRQ
jgi:hypothetical protein